MKPLLLSACMLLVGLLAGCDGTDHSVSWEGDLLSLSAEARDGRVYLLAPATDAVVEIDPGARDWTSISVGRGPTALSRPPTRDELFTLERQDSTLSRLNLDGDVDQWDLGAPFTTLSWAPDGTRAIAWIEPALASSIEVEGSLNLNAYAVIREAEDGSLEITPGSLTFQPQDVSYSADGRHALIASTARLHVFDLDADPVLEQAVPFSADEAVHRTPNLVVPAPDSN